MKRKILVLGAVVALVSVLALAAVPVAAEPAERVDVLIGFHHPPGAAEQAMVRDAGGDIKYTFRIVPVIAASLPEPAIDALLQKAGVRYIEPDHEVYALEQAVSWGIDRVFGDDIYPFPTWQDSVGAGIGVAVLDTGIDGKHEDLPQLLGSAKFTTDAGDWDTDGNGHGTHVAGTIAALDNTWGVVGVAPEIGLYSVQVLPDLDSGWASDLVAGIEWAVDQGIPVLNMSLGGSHSQTIQEACDNAYLAGHLLVAAAGNDGNEDGTGDNVGYPARYDSVVAVAASDYDDDRADFSSTGPAVELIAPGVNILSTLPGNEYGAYSGTSMASPHVAGVASLAWAANPDLTNVQIRGILQETAEDLELPANHQGYGLVRADLAVAAALDTLASEPGYTFTTADSISIAPVDEEVVAGEDVTYTATAYDEFGNEIGDVTADADFSIEADAGGSWDGNTYTTEKAGTWTVTAQYGGLEVTAGLAVQEDNGGFFDCFGGCLDTGTSASGLILGWGITGLVMLALPSLLRRVARK